MLFLPINIKKEIVKKINIVTLGCSKNTVDSEQLGGQLSASGLEIIYDQYNYDAETVVINTCGFINDAKEESVNTILDFAQAKTEGKIRRLYVMGCLAERYKKDLEKDIPEADEFFGVNNLREVVETLKADYRKELIGERKLSAASHFAYLKISEGCNRQCSFCAIPLIRGKHRSVPLENLLTEARKLADKGVKELILIAQDLSYYGLDLYKKPMLPELLEKLAKIKGLRRIRLHYAYPALFPEGVFKVMREHKNICNYIDIPLQHISDKMLKIMRRGYGKEKTLEIINKLRKEVPGVAIRTTLLVGHPGETDEDFEELLSFVKEQKFERLGVFTYSHEEDTHAGDTMKNSISEEEKNRRAELVMETQKNIAYEHNSEKTGKVFEVLIDREDDEYFVGRTEFDSPEVDNEVFIEKSENMQTGEFYDVLITDAGDYELFGKLYNT
jgi:ribosomal protein S12 methylthiotransferase